MTFTGCNTFCQGDSARQYIIDTFGWSITDSGKECATTWTGQENDNWSNPNNWTNGIPVWYLEAIIPNVSPNPQPEIDAPGAVCKSLSNQPGSMLTIKTGGELRIEEQE